MAELYEGWNVSADRMGGFALGICPVCQSALYSRDVKVHTFNCPHCGKALIPDRGRAYFWFRLVFEELAQKGPERLQIAPKKPN
jgi:predicted RNA-binding Zn-ribbon protein involved in translation (DUF1610 family)